MPNTSIVIVTHDRGEYIDLTLAGFLTQTDKDFELIIVDDGSTDNTREIVNKYTHKINIIYKYDFNKGRALARNTGFELCNGRYVIFADSDRIPCPGFVEEHVRLLTQNKKTVSIGKKHMIMSLFKLNLRITYMDMINIIKNNDAVLKNTLYMEKFYTLTSEDITNNFNSAIKSVYLRETRDNYHEVVKEYSSNLTEFQMGWAMATTGNAAFEVSSASSSIRFDGNYNGWGLEDTDFFYQCHLKGYSFKFNTDASNFHQIHPRSPSEQDELNTNFRYFCKKYNEPAVSLFTGVFKGDYSLSYANKVLNELGHSNDSLIAKEFVRLVQEKYAH